MATPAFRPLTPSRTLGTSARIIRQSQAFRKPFNKKLGWYSGLVFAVVFAVLNLLHGNLFGQVDVLGFETYQSASNLWHHAFIGNGPAGAKVDSVYNPVQFLLYLIGSVLSIPLPVLVVLQAFGLTFLLGYQFARYLVDRAQNWVIGLAVIVSTIIFVNGDFVHSVNVASHQAWFGLIFLSMMVEMAVDVRRQTVRSRIFVLVGLASVCHPLGFLLVLPVLYLYYNRSPKGANQNALNLIFTYGLGIAIGYQVLRLIYFGTLGFFDPIINFQWQLSVHGFHYLIGGCIKTLLQFEDASGLWCLVLLVLALFVERQPGLGLLGLSIVTSVIVMSLAAFILPMQANTASNFVWMTPLMAVVPAYFVMNPLPHFIPSWNTRLFITALTVVMIAGVTWTSKAHNLVVVPNAQEPLERAIAQLGINMPVVYGVMPTMKPNPDITWASNGRIDRLLTPNPGAYLEWFFECVAPDVLLLSRTDPKHQSLKQDARFGLTYMLFSQGGAEIPDVYLRKEMQQKGEEYQLLKRLENALDKSSDLQIELPRLVKQEKKRLEGQGGVYHLQPLVRSLTKLAVRLEWVDCLEDIGNIMAETEGGALNRMLVTASYTARFDVELVDELTRYYFVSNFTQGNARQMQLLLDSPDPVSTLPNSPGFQDGKIKVYLNRNSMVVYLPNASNVDTLSPFFVKINQFVGQQHDGKVLFDMPSFKISDQLNLLGPSDGYASFALPGQGNVSTIEIGQRNSNHAIIWTTSFSVNHVRNRDAF